MLKFYITGDIHGDLTRLENLELNKPKNQIGIIILGDSGFNYWSGARMQALKEKANEIGYYIYCVRGNHEDRPENIEDMKLIYDENVDGNVYMEFEYPKIRYFVDGGKYKINGLRVGVIGGAYSVDKSYRQLMGWQWFEGEQLSYEERLAILEDFEEEYFDIILTHTCPFSWQPTDLFLSSIDQEHVDNTMEHFLEVIAERAVWRTWCWGHFHDDREYHFGDSIYADRRRIMFLNDVTPIEEIV